jgi:hypothetical protein
MKNEPQSIEVEVVEIDGAAPKAKFEAHEEAPAGKPWQDWQGRIRSLDSRWWPLWVLLGVIAIGLLLTVGLVIGVIWVILRILNAMGRALFPDR